MKDTKSKKLINTKKAYEDAVASSNPTKISGVELQDLAKRAVKKFKSLN